MTLRELPAGEGRSCYLISDGDGALSRLADHVEEALLQEARHVAGMARNAIQASHHDVRELIVLVSRLHDAVINAAHIAEARGHSDAE